LTRRAVRLPYQGQLHGPAAFLPKKKSMAYKITNTMSTRREPRSLRGNVAQQARAGIYIDGKVLRAGASIVLPDVVRERLRGVIDRFADTGILLVEHIGVVAPAETQEPVSQEIIEKPEEAQQAQDVPQLPADVPPVEVPVEVPVDHVPTVSAPSPIETPETPPPVVEKHKRKPRTI